MDAPPTIADTCGVPLCREPAQRGLYCHRHYHLVRRHARAVELIEQTRRVRRLASRAAQDQERADTAARRLAEAEAELERIASDITVVPA